MPIPVLNAADVLQLTIATYFTPSRQLGLNTSHWQVTVSGAPPANVSDFVNVMDSLFAPLYKLAISGGAKYYGCRAVKVFPAGAPAPQTATANTGAGLVGTQVLPTAIAGILKFTTANVGRKFRGRNYIPFPDATFLAAAGAEPTAAYVAAILNIGAVYVPQAIIVGGRSATVTPVICNKAGTAPVSPITNVLSEGDFGTQHRRGDFGRTNNYPPF